MHKTPKLKHPLSRRRACSAPQQTPITWQIAYDSRGRVTRFERTHAQAYNVDGNSNRLTGFSQTTTTTKGTRTLSTVSASVNYPLDAAGNILGDGLRSFGYDANNRHSQTTLAGSGVSASDAPKISYLHNAFGQRVFKSEPQNPRLSRPDPATNSPGFSQWLRSTFPWMYDGEGEDEAEGNDDDKKDKDGKGSSKTSLLGHSYVYDDALGGANTLLGEYGNGGPNSAGQAEYIWLPTDSGQTIPIGLYKNKRLYAIHSDHLDTPRQITDDSNQPVWQWPYSAFGDNLPTGVLKAKKVESEGNDDREREGSRVTTTSVITTATVQLKATDPAITLNLRFAGQYRDSETGLFYNGMRSYAPQLGAYTQMDPIGLGGGLNRRGYVEGNPFSATDPTGERIPLSFYFPRVTPPLGPLLPAPAPSPYNPVTDTFTPQPAAPNFTIPPFPIVVPIVNIINAINAIVCNISNTNQADCRKASPWDLAQAGITDEHEYKREQGALPFSQWDICKCKDGSIRIARTGQCGKTNRFWE